MRRGSREGQNRGALLPGSTWNCIWWRWRDSTKNLPCLCPIPGDALGSPALKEIPSWSSAAPARDGPASDRRVSSPAPEDSPTRAVTALHSGGHPSPPAPARASPCRRLTPRRGAAARSDLSVSPLKGSASHRSASRMAAPLQSRSMCLKTGLTARSGRCTAP